MIAAIRRLVVLRAPSSLASATVDDEAADGGRYVPAIRKMNEYYEDLWARLPEELEPPDLELRRAFLLDGIRPGDRVLDLGSGAGDFTAEIARSGARPVGVEVAKAALDRARNRHPALDFRLAPIDGPLPLEDGEFEVVWSSEVIEHVADTARWLSEVRRVLTPGGRLLLTTPSHGRVRVALGGVERFSEPLGDHLHLYTRRSLEEVLGELGFDGVSVRTAAGPPLLRRLLLAQAHR
jgi:SAM-dependent methyltransferase